ncbi:glycosyl hydrolase family 8 [Olleya sp. Bg11-27]|uniref:glycosyl hydrolase family 8 n=1 Tax=Olleya sp. Bg11-27 TaxID=2058135 RepID=UPI000C30085C|nr:glycosyl hydrolase family 8 [Olleya sp. Bg11-27]AUC77575.1 hypothetical protein CW732_18580 [Olleya sp. Bg11-27]
MMKNTKIFSVLCLSILFWTTSLSAQQLTQQVETMSFGGAYAGQITTPFNGGAFYGNGDNASATINLQNTPGLFNVAIVGASSSNSLAQIDLYVGGAKVSTYSFNGTALQTVQKELVINSTAIELRLSTDPGNNDTLLDRISFSYLGTPPPPRTAPVIPSQSAYESGDYRNVFVEAGKDPNEVADKLEAMWNQFFVNGNPNSESLLYNVGNDMAYILDTGNNDIRSEGQSYAMMISVQLKKEAVFKKLWKWAKTYSQWAPGTDREGLFSWQVERTGDFNKKDDNSAPDGEEYYVTALFFADALWGSQEYPGPFNPVNDIFDYKGQANYILDNMLNKPLANSGGCPTNLVDLDEKQIVFGICGQSATFTDPSYHLAAFYDIWAANADNNRQLWADMADVSRRELLPNAAHPVTGLMPDYSTFQGVPTGSQPDFQYDAWRNIMNMSFDFNWFQKDGAILKPLINRQIDFFIGQGGAYGDRFNVNGTQLGGDHSPGLVATNAVAALAMEDSKIWAFVDELYDTATPTGRFRYYNGLLYMMSYMHLAGEFKILTSGSIVTNPDPDPQDCNGTPLPSAAISKTNETVAGANDGAITFTFPDVNGRSTIEFSNDGGVTYSLNINDNSGTATFNNLADGIYSVWTRWGDNSCPIDLGNVTIEAGGTVIIDGQTPFVTHNIPGTIEAENYDNGGQGVAYNDNDASNNGGQGRQNEGVDLENTTDLGGGTNLAWTVNGEWIEYTVANVVEGNYNITFRVASITGNSKSIEASIGAHNLGTVNVPNTNGWQSWQSVSLNNVALSGGTNQVLRININGGAFNINWVKFEAILGNDGGDQEGDPCSVIEAEDNTQNYYQLNNNNGVIDNIGYSHWMKFDNVNISGGKFTYRYSKGNNENGYMKVRIDNNNDGSNIAEVYPSSTGTWNNYQESTVNIKGSGMHTVYLYFHNTSKNIQLDWIKFGDNCSPKSNEQVKLSTVIENDFTVYPNPSSGDVNIKFNNAQDRSVTIYNTLGSVVYRNDLILDSAIKVNNLKNGVYFIQTNTSGSTQTKKLVVR